jgi:hypothetical protein
MGVPDRHWKFHDQADKQELSRRLGFAWLSRDLWHTCMTACMLNFTSRPLHPDFGVGHDR